MKDTVWTDEGLAKLSAVSRCADGDPLSPAHPSLEASLVGISAESLQSA